MLPSRESINYTFPAFCWVSKGIVYPVSPWVPISAASWDGAPWPSNASSHSQQSSTLVAWPCLHYLAIGYVRSSFAAEHADRS